MRKPLLAANWKMNGSLTENEKRLTLFKEKLSNLEHQDIVIFPPAIYIPQTANLLYNSDISWGFQNIFHESMGAYTGEHSPGMAKDYGVSYALVGHSERRLLFGETDHQILKKIAILLEFGMTPIVCIGETLSQYKNHETLDVLKRQLKAFLDPISCEQQDLVIAYEPVWAIGTGKAATESEVQVVHENIRLIVSEYDQWDADLIRIIYGGSVTAQNSNHFLAQPDIDGLLVGGASLKSDEFISICTQ